jgi:hypothetical protein
MVATLHVLLITLYLCKRRGFGSMTTVLLQPVVGVSVQVLILLRSLVTDVWTGWQLYSEKKRRD